MSPAGFKPTIPTNEQPQTAQPRGSVDCNVRSYINFSVLGVGASFEEVKLVVDEIQTFVVVPQ
jgi:hypothetical protein